jgi:predicted DNA-binding transcriptional regulator AlpA
MENADKLMPDSAAADAEASEKWLRKKAVASLLSISRHTLDRMIKRDPSFPRFIELSPGIHVIRISKILEWRRRKELETYEKPPAAHDATR